MSSLPTVYDLRKLIFDAYGLFGHPSYLILDETGEILWQSVGEQTGEFIENSLQSFLDD